MSIVSKAVDNHIKNKQQQVKRGINWAYDVDSDDEVLYKIEDTSNISGNSRALIMGTKGSRMETVNTSQLSLVRSAFGGYCKNYLKKIQIMKLPIIIYFLKIQRTTYYVYYQDWSPKVL